MPARFLELDQARCQRGAELALPLGLPARSTNPNRGRWQAATECVKLHRGQGGSRRHAAEVPGADADGAVGAVGCGVGGDVLKLLRMVRGEGLRVVACAAQSEKFETRHGLN